MAEEEQGINEVEGSLVKEKEPQPTELKIVSWNAGLQGYERFGGAVKEFINSGADVIAIQETGTKPNEDGKINTRKIQEELGDDYDVYFTGSSREFVEKRQFHEREDMREESGGLTLIVKKDKVNVNLVQPINLPALPKLSLVEKLKTYGGRPDERQAQVAEINLDHKTYLLVNAHFDWQGGMGHKEDQLKYLGEYLGRKVTPDGILIVGDINVLNGKGARESAEALTYEVPGKKSEFKEVVPPNPTVEVAGLGMKPDLAFVQGGIKVDQVETSEDSYGSDHKPVVLNVKL